MSATLNAFGGRKAAGKGALRKLDRALAATSARERYAAAPSYGRAKSPGIIFGTINGVKGYWRRPKTTAPTGPRHKGVRQVAAEGAPTLLLLKVQVSAVYKERFRYNEVIEAACREFGAPTEFARELDRAISMAIDRTAIGPSTPSTTSGGAGSRHDQDQWRAPLRRSGPQE